MKMKIAYKGRRELGAEDIEDLAIEAPTNALVKTSVVAGRGRQLIL